MVLKTCFFASLFVFFQMFFLPKRVQTLANNAKRKIITDLQGVRYNLKFLLSDILQIFNEHGIHYAYIYAILLLYPVTY